MLTISSTGELTLDSSDNNLIFDGENRESRGSFIYSNGKLTINGGSFKNDYCDSGMGRGPIKAEKTGSSIIFNSGLVENNNYKRNAAYSSGGFYVGDGAEMIMNGGLIQKNIGTAYEYPGLPNGIWSDSPGGGGIYIGNGASFTMNNGEIKGNKGWGGGIFIGNGSPYDYDRSATNIASLKKQKLAKATFNGGKITGNYGIGGGGISANGNVDVLIPEKTSLLVDGNNGYQGGGIFISDWAVDGIGLEKEVAKLSIDEWSKVYAGKFTMEGGTVTNNKAARCGAGINISSNGGYIKGGLVKNNSAGDQGGGIYLTTIPYTLHIENALIANNSAYIGGGIWLCPTGSGKFIAENGGIMYENKARNRGDDFVNEAGEDVDYLVSLANRTPDGGKITYYKDDASSGRVREGGEKKEYTKLDNINEKVALKAEISPENIKETKKLTSLTIGENYAPRGGGLASNGAIVIGKETSKNKDVELIKKWADGTPSKEVEAEVRIKYNKEGEEIDYLIEKVVLNEKNNFKVTIKNLPEKVNGNPIEDIIYLKELNADKYIVTYENPIKDTTGITDNEKYIYTFINKKVVDWTPIIPAKTKLSVNKEWRGIDASKAPSLEVFLVKNGVVTDKKLTLNKDNQWSGEFKELDVVDSLDSASKNIYTVKENGEDGGEVTLDGGKYKVTYKKDGTTILIKNEKEIEPPTKPTEPTTRETTSPEKPKKVVETGDRDKSFIYVALLVAGGFIVFISIYFKRKSKSEN